MRIIWIGSIACLILLSCSYEFDNPFDSKSTVEPTAPGGLKAMALNDSTIELTWEDSQGEIGYKIERGIDGDPLQAIGSISQNGTHFADEGLQIDRRYSYRVIAFAANGKEAYANVVKELTTTGVILVDVPWAK